MDALNQYYAELDRLQGIYDSERNYDYGMWADNRDFSYAQYRDQVADQQWQAQWDENIRRYNFENGLGEFAPTGGGGDDEDSGSGTTLQYYYNHAADIAKEKGSADASAYIMAQDALSGSEKGIALDQIQGVALTEKYKKMMGIT